MIAVATMTDAACVILPEDLTVPSDITEKAAKEGLTIFSSKDNAYKLAVKISQLTL